MLEGLQLNMTDKGTLESLVITVGGTNHTYKAIYKNFSLHSIMMPSLATLNVNHLNGELSDYLDKGLPAEGATTLDILYNSERTLPEPVQAKIKEVVEANDNLSYTYLLLLVSAIMGSI